MSNSLPLQPASFGESSDQDEFAAPDEMALGEDLPGAQKSKSSGAQKLAGEEAAPAAREKAVKGPTKPKTRRKSSSGVVAPESQRDALARVSERPQDGVVSVHETEDGQRREEVVIKRGRKRHVVTLTREAATKDLLLLSEFPFAILGKGDKKDAQRLLNRIEHQWDTRNGRGKMVRAIWRVSGDEDYGLPTSIDERVYLVLMQLTVEQNFPARVRFTTRNLLTRLGWGDSSERYDDVTMAMRRLSGVRLFGQNVMRAVPGRPGDFVFGESGSSLIGNYYLRDKRPAGGQASELPVRLARGHGFEAGSGVGDATDLGAELLSDWQSANTSHFSWSLPVQELLRAGQLRTLSLEFALSLERPTALRLARYLGKKAFDGKDSFEIGLARLCGMHLGMTPSPHDSVMRQRLQAAHDELVTRNFLTKVEYSEMKTREGQKVRYEFGPLAFGAETGPSQLALALDKAEGAPLKTSGGEATQQPPSQAPMNEAQATSAPAPDTIARDDEAARLIAQMESIGVSPATARELWALVGTTEVELQLACLADREPRDRAATFVKATRGGWAPPAAYDSRLEGQALEQKRRRASEDAERRRAEERESQQRESERQQNENAHLDALWNQLEAPARAALEREAVDRLGILGSTGRAPAALAVMRRSVLREKLGELEEAL